MYSELLGDNLLFAENTAYGLRGLGALRKPIARPLRIDLDLDRVANRAILPQNLEKTAIPRPSFIDNHNPIKRAFLGPDTGKTHCYQTVSLLSFNKTLRLYRVSK